MEFKIGDKVRLVNLNTSFLGYFADYEDTKKPGDILTLERRHEHAPDFWYVEEDSIWVYSEDDMELVVENSDQNINYILTPTGITVSFDGKLESISEGDHRYSQILAAIKQGNLELIPELVDVQKSFEGLKHVELVDGRIKINGQDIPEVVSDRVLKFKEQGLPFEPLVKFAEKLQRNPSFNSRQMLYKFLEHNGHPITANGNFIAYKKVRSDFRDCHTGTMDNSVGKVVEMPRESVDDNPNNTCSSGLHVAAYNYAKGFGSGHLMLVEVDPEDVVSVPNDYNGEKMRVCRYEVKEICESKLESEFYGERYSEERSEDFIEDFWGNEISVGDEVILDGEYRGIVTEVDSFDNTLRLDGEDIDGGWFDGDEVELA